MAPCLRILGFNKRINLNASPVDMAFEFSILQVFIDAEIELVWQEKVISFIFSLNFKNIGR